MSKLKHSKGFLFVFNFFLKGYRKDILTFPGSIINTSYNKNGKDALDCFKAFDNGLYKNLYSYPTSQPNVLKAIITAKKAWGLLVNDWAEGIADGLFLKEEFFQMFQEADLEIPPQFIKDFYNRVYSKMNTRFNKNEYKLSSLNS
jgi:hypothetical protein